LFKALQKNKDILERIFEPSILEECRSSFSDLMRQLDSSYSNKSPKKNSTPGVEKMEVRDSSEAESAPKSGEKKSMFAKVSMADEDGKKGDSESAAAKERDVSGAQDISMVAKKEDRSKSSSSSSESSSGGSSSCNDQEDKKMPGDEPVVDDKSDSDDNSSDSDSSSTSGSSPDPNSSEDDDDEEDEEKQVVGMVKKPRLSSTTSRRESVSVFHQMSISLHPTHQVPEGGVFDPEFPELAEQYALKVLEYLEEVSDRLATAQLQNEVRSLTTASFPFFLIFFFYSHHNSFPFSFYFAVFPLLLFLFPFSFLLFSFLFFSFLFFSFLFCHFS